MKRSDFPGRSKPNYDDVHPDNRAGPSARGPGSSGRPGSYALGGMKGGPPFEAILMTVSQLHHLDLPLWGSSLRERRATDS